MRRIGLYGGTFDPPHLGHTEMLLQAKKQLDLDMVIVLPCGDPVHKSGVTNKQQRYEMCKNVVEKSFLLWKFENVYAIINRE